MFNAFTKYEWNTARMKNKSLFFIFFDGCKNMDVDFLVKMDLLHKNLAVTTNIAVSTLRNYYCCTNNECSAHRVFDCNTFFYYIQICSVKALVILDDKQNHSK